MNNDAINSIIRHTITGVGGIFIAKGVGDAAVWEAVGGLATAVIGFLILRKKNSAKPVNA